MSNVTQRQHQGQQIQPNAEKFTFRPPGSSPVVIELDLHVTEFEEFAKNVVERIRTADKYFYEAHNLKKITIPKLTTSLAVFKQKNETLTEENQNLTDNVYSLQEKITILERKLLKEQEQSSSLHKQLAIQKQNYEKELDDMNEMLSTERDKLEKSNIQLTIKDKEHCELQTTHIELMEIRKSWLDTNNKQKLEIEKLEEIIKKEKNKFRKAIRGREELIDSLRMEMDSVKLQSDCDLEEERKNHKKECDDLREQLAKLTNKSIEKDSQEKNLKDENPPLISNTLQKCINNIVSNMEQKETTDNGDRKRHAESPSDEEVTFSKKNRSDPLLDTDAGGKKSIFMKRIYQEKSLEETTARKNRDDQRKKIIKQSKGGKVLEEILLDDSTDNEEYADNVDKMDQKQTDPKKKLPLPQWKLLQESAASTMALAHSNGFIVEKKLLLDKTSPEVN